MEDLLMIYLISHYNLPAPTIANWLIQTEEKYFEIEDTNAGEIVLHSNRGLGMGRFSNADALSITVVSYDKFITSVKDVYFKNGRKRCDIIISCNTDGYFILGELKDRYPKEQVRSNAKKQLLLSLQTLSEVPEIIAYINSKKVKRCCYFNKQSSSPDILTVTTAFNRLSNVNPEGFRMSKPEIEAFGFEFYEYTGVQTMILSDNHD